MESSGPGTGFRSYFARTLIAGDVLGISLFFVSTIWHDFIEFYFGFEFNRSAVFCFAILLCGASTAFRITRDPLGIVGKYRIPLAVAVYFTLCVAGQFLAGEAIGQNYTFLVAPLAAVAMLSTDRRIVISLLIATVAVSLAFEIVEFLSCKYFFVFDNGVYKLDELLYSGSLHSFRAKGLFTSPLSGNYVALLAILLTGLSIPVIAMSFLSAILAISKGAVVSSAALLFLRLLTRGNWIRSTAMAALAIVALLGFAQLTRDFVCVWPNANSAAAAPYKRPSPLATDQPALAAAPTDIPERASPRSTAKNAIPRMAAPEAPIILPEDVPPPSAEEYAIPREVGRLKLVQRINRNNFDLAEFLGTALDPSASTTSYRLFVWEENLRYFLNFDPLHMLFGWPHFAYLIPIQGTESSVIKELEDYGIVGFVFSLIVKFFAARRLWPVSKNLTIAGVGYYLLATVQPTFTTLGTCVLFWLFILIAASKPEALRPRAWVLRRP